jgi:hypothetical protein
MVMGARVEEGKKQTMQLKVAHAEDAHRYRAFMKICGYSWRCALGRPDPRGPPTLPRSLCSLLCEQR